MKPTTASMVTLLIIGLLNLTQMTFAAKGSGQIIAEERSVSNFDKIYIELPGVLHIKQGDVESLVIEADDNLLPSIKTTVSLKTLKISRKWFHSLEPSKPIVYQISLRDISSLEVWGSVKIFSDAIKSDDLSFEISGSAKTDITYLECTKFNLEINGSGDLKVQGGQIKNQDISINGSGDLSMEGVRTESTNLQVNGSGSTSIWVTDTLNVQINGSGNLSYFGSPVVSSEVNGSGIIDALGEKN